MNSSRISWPSSKMPSMAGQVCRRLTKDFKHLNEALDLAFRFLQVFVERGLQFFGLGAACS